MIAIRCVCMTGARRSGGPRRVAKRPTVCQSPVGARRDRGCASFAVRRLGSAYCGRECQGGSTTAAAVASTAALAQDLPRQCGHGEHLAAAHPEGGARPLACVVPAGAGALLRGGSHDHRVPHGEPGGCVVPALQFDRFAPNDRHQLCCNHCVGAEVTIVCWSIPDVE